MIKFFTTSLFLLFIAQVCAQDNSNLDFEASAQQDSLPEQWIRWGTKGYVITTDTIHSFSGKQSASIQSPYFDSQFGALAYKIPNGYNGKNIKVEAYLKTENVKEGYAGLLLRLDKGSTTVGFDNMQKNGVIGTNDWVKYEITLPFKEADAIYVGGLLSGTGKVWFDDFKVSVDGKNVKNLKFKERKLAKAEQDHEFDNGSHFSVATVTEEKITRLLKLGQIWGKLKYTNPKIAKGKYNWDYELFRALPLIKAEDYKKELSSWKASYGKETDKIRNRNYYIDFTKGVGNPIFKNENTYPDMDFSDDGYRLLGLFRYWNMINYFYPYKKLINKDWDEVLKEYIPKIIEGDDELSYKLTLLELIGEVQDSHANIWNQNQALKGFFGIKVAPVKLEFVQNEPVVVKKMNELSSDSQIQVGDRLLSINGKKVTTFIEEKGKYFPASNRSAKLRNIARRLLRTNDDKISLEFSNGKKTYTETLATYPLENIDSYTVNTPSHKTLPNNIGYIYPGTLEKGEINEIMPKFMDKKGIVIDLRCYPSDFIVFSLARYLMPQPTSFVKFETATGNKLGEFEISKPLKVGHKVSDNYKGKIAILVNEETQSQAEYTTMAFQVAPKAKVFGSQTAGADGNVSKIALPGNVMTMISGIGVLYPNGEKTQQKGVRIDQEIEPSIKGIRAEKDEVLEKALEYINE